MRHGHRRSRGGLYSWYGWQMGKQCEIVGEDPGHECFAEVPMSHLLWSILST